MFKKAILILSFSIFVESTYSKNFLLNPPTKSILIPGWGESTLKRKDQSKYFFIFEMSLWTSYLGLILSAKHKKNQYQAYAAEYAGVNPNYKNHEYWVDIGNYLDIHQHNAEHLRWRFINDLYSNDFSWNWSSVSHMKKFEKMRIDSDMYLKYGEYMLGVITMNHIISAINSLYILKLEKKIQLKPNLSNTKLGIELIVRI